MVGSDIANAVEQPGVIVAGRHYGNSGVNAWLYAGICQAQAQTKLELATQANVLRRVHLRFEKKEKT